VDYAVQAVVAHRLAAAFPADPLVAEEDAGRLRRPDAGPLVARVEEAVRRVEPRLAGEAMLAAIERGRAAPGARFWTLDPIDGTRGLLRGGQYVIALALVVDGRPRVAAIGCPRLSLAAGTGEGGVAVAAAGRGSWWWPGQGSLNRLRVSPRADPAAARIAHSVEESHSDRERLAQARTALGAAAEPVLMDSQAKHVMVAAGEADVLLRFPRAGYHEAIWDLAAGALVIGEAGGRVTDLAGAPLDFSTGRHLVRNTGLVATNGALHDAVLRACAVHGD
jgi:3'(2'), 5'-bisphosphate nucleotidase